MSVQILAGDCREVLKTLPDESVHCVVTSPPYWGLRDYGVEGQLGLEATPAEYIEKMVAVFREVRRVLRKDGTLWLNLGDSYHNAGYAKDRVKAEDSLQRSNLAANFIGAPNRMPQEGLKPKDLVGMPWRIAFALQAPDYLGRIRSETDRAWLAGLVDGEGCITILEATSPHGSGSSYPPVLQVRMCDPECIDKAMQLVGSEGENPAQYPPSVEGQRPVFQWRIHGRKAADTIAEIYPFLLIKRKQAIVAWNHQAVRDGYTTKRGVRIPEDALAKQIACRDLIQRLNRREPVDIPSWMIEPPQPIGPGWYLRQDVIWSKPNPMPESVRDRCTKAHEYLFLLAKSERYYFDQDAILEPASLGTHARLAQNGLAEQRGSDRVPGKTNGPMKAVARKDQVGHNGRAIQEGFASHTNHGGTGTRKLAAAGSGTKNNASSDEAMAVMPIERNKRSVWTVTTQPFKEAHFATFPPALIEPCVLAGCPAGGVVLDPFFGAGTTGLVADHLGRNCIGIELNPDYVAMAEQRMRGTTQALPLG